MLLLRGRPAGAALRQAQGPAVQAQGAAVQAQGPGEVRRFSLWPKTISGVRVSWSPAGKQERPELSLRPFAVSTRCARRGT
ncbi:hypothetical protein PLANTIT3_61366 [Plantibacter sp. T3]|nr:hypothetical protein PLANTIT3_61366 [Plantibacter sp. T3]